MKSLDSKIRQAVIAAIKLFITLITYFSMLPFPEETNSLFIMIIVFSLSRLFTNIESLLNGITTPTTKVGIELFISIIISIISLLVGMVSAVQCKTLIAIIVYIACGVFLVLDVIDFFNLFSNKKNKSQLPPLLLQLEEE